MGSIRRPSNSGSIGTKGIEFIRCVDGHEPQIHKIWCLGYDGVTLEVHLTAQIEVCAGTVGQFMTNYLAENGCRTPVIGQFSITGSVKLLGIPFSAWGHVLLFIENLQAPTATYGWGDANNSNQKWGVIQGELTEMLQ